MKIKIGSVVVNIYYEGPVQAEEKWIRERYETNGNSIIDVVKTYRVRHGVGLPDAVAMCKNALGVEVDLPILKEALVREQNRLRKGGKVK
jgi:hypothetical protein